MKAALDWVRRAFFSAPPDDPQAPTAPVSFEEAVRHYSAALLTRSLDPKTISNKLGALRYMEAVFAGRMIGTIRPFEVARLVRQVHDAGKLVTARQVLGVARDLLNEALMQGWLDANPALHVKRLPAPVRRQRLTLDQFQTIADVARRCLPPWVAPMLMLALVTAQRRSDLVRLRTDQARDGHLFIEQYKTGARVAIPLTLRLDAVGVTVGEAIRACQVADSPWVVHRMGGACLQAQSLTNRFTDARDLAGLASAAGTPPSLHEVRSLAERLYRAEGVDTQTLLGHKTSRMTDLYNDDRGLSAANWKFVRIPER